MNNYKSELLRDKVISIWGMGYLGYTTALRLVNAGFHVNIYHFDNIDLEKELLNGNYPSLEQKSLWSINADIPNIDLSKITIKKQSSEMFNTNTHIIAIPIIGQSPNTLNSLINIFKNNYSNEKDVLILFQAAETPGVIENQFIDVLVNDNIKYFFGSAFRSDWNVEEFFSNKYTRVIAGYDQSALEKTKILFDLFNINYIEQSSIKESEVYVNAKNSLEYTISGFLNQLSLAYSDIDISSFSSTILSDLDVNDFKPGFSSTDFKNANSIEHLLQSTRDSSMCTIIQEAQSTNMSLILHYADLLKRKEVNSVIILGISTQDTLKDIRYSPSLIIAEYLNKLGLNIFINDPNFTGSEIEKILPFAPFIDLNSNIEQEAILLMKDYSEYRFLTQKCIEDNGMYDAKIIIDNIGLFEDLTFSENTLYHKIGDGNLKRLSR